MSTGAIEMVRTPDDAVGVYPDDWRRLLRQAREHGASREATYKANVGSSDDPADLTAEQARDIGQALGRVAGDDMAAGVADFLRRGPCRVEFMPW